MKNQCFKTLVRASIVTTLCATLASCANYRAKTLENLPLYSVNFPTQKNHEPTILAKAFSTEDCKKYLDRDVIASGYRPVQIQIENSTDAQYFFSLNRVSVPCANSVQVADSVHTSTVARAVGYGTAAFLTCGLFLIPAIVDSVKSSEANHALDQDFLVKAAKDQVIYPHSHVNMLLFVPASSYQSTFTISLVDMETQKLRTYYVTPAVA